MILPRKLSSLAIAIVASAGLAGAQDAPETQQAPPPPAAQEAPEPQPVPPPEGSVVDEVAPDKAEPPPRTVDAQTAADVAYWEEMAAATPKDVTVRLALGNAYALSNRFSDAVRQYRLVLHDYPQYKEAWNNLGSAYRAMGRKSRAVEAYHKALKIDPRYALAYYNIGVVYDSAGHYEKAIAYYGEAVKYDPNLLDPRKNPQVVKNRKVFAILLHNYVKSSGALALPLEPAYPAPEE
ncbi:MAG TPA: tetratricopeptide repeat protein [Candidatus Polarisedimenticolia bacterium]|nr:tetratricopeptide repeat protein [Candidatus Polarisedimenticolia bacterium]